MISEQFYKVGDVVRIVCTPCESVFYWNQDMTKHCNKCAVIYEIGWHGGIHKSYGYRLCFDGDYTPWIWDSNCFSLVEKRPESMYQIGDEVVIVDEPYHKCVFSWAKEMDKYCGKEAIIFDKEYDPRKCEYGYCLKIDGEEIFCLWCEGCFRYKSEIKPITIEEIERMV